MTMKFTLLFYTDGWESGPTVELSHVPAPGSVVWIGPRRRDDEDGEMYYVDNVMYPERGMDRDDTVYLYVRPYNGYMEYGPKTEADRIAERLVGLQEEVAGLRAGVDMLVERNERLLKELVRLRETAVRNGEKVSELGGQIAQSVEAIEDNQQGAAEKLDDIALGINRIAYD